MEGLEIIGTGIGASIAMLSNGVPGLNMLLNILTNNILNERYLQKLPGQDVTSLTNVGFVSTKESEFIAVINQMAKLLDISETNETDITSFINSLSNIFNTNTNLDITNTRGETLMMKTVQSLGDHPNELYDILKAMLEHGANPNIVSSNNNQSYTLIEQLIKKYQYDSTSKYIDLKRFAMLLKEHDVNLTRNNLSNILPVNLPNNIKALFNGDIISDNPVTQVTNLWVAGGGTILGVITYTIFNKQSSLKRVVRKELRVKLTKQALFSH